MRFVYLAGPIGGLTEAGAKDWRKEAAERLKPWGIIGISPLRCEPAINGSYKAEAYPEDPLFGNAKAIGSKNRFDTLHADFVLAYLPERTPGQEVSIGTIIEIGWAHGKGIPVIVVSDDPVIMKHPLIDFCASWKLETVQQAVNLLIGILDGYTGGKNV